PLSRHWSDRRGALRVFLQQIFVLRASRGHPSSFLLQSRTRTTALTALGCSGRRTKSSVEEFPNSHGNFLTMRFESEVTNWVEVDLCLGIIPPECLGSGREKKRTVLAPHRQQRWLMPSDVRLELRIESDIAGVVEKEIELGLMRSWTRHIVVI